MRDRASTIERLERYKRVQSDTGCWLWTGALTQDGYGKMKYHGKTYKAHQVSAVIYLNHNLYGTTQVNHKRECPNRHCFNPEHLYEGTHVENARDRKTSNLTCGKGHYYSGGNTYVDRMGNRHCKTCRRTFTQQKRFRIKNA